MCVGLSILINISQVQFVFFLSADGELIVHCAFLCHSLIMHKYSEILYLLLALQQPCLS